MTLIYSNNSYTDHVIALLNLPDPVVICHDIDQFAKAPAQTKLAFVNHISDYCRPVDEQQRIAWVTNGAKFCQEVAELAHISQLVFAFDTEFHAYHCDMLLAVSAPHVHWVLPAVVTHTPANTVFNCFWFEWVSGHYLNGLIHCLQQLQTHTVKPQAFDALLGWPRQHRDFVFAAVQTLPRPESVLITYMNRELHNFATDFPWEPEIAGLDQVSNSAHEVKYYGSRLPLSHVVPISIYNQTAYSIVTETQADNRWTFFTEKTIKPLLAKRLFVAFAGQHYLRRLTQLGFQTFASVIDESYDSIEDDQQRWQAAFAQVQRLLTLDQAWVFAQIEPVVQHNYTVAMTTDWRHQTVKQIETICLKRIALNQEQI